MGDYNGFNPALRNAKKTTLSLSKEEDEKRRTKASAPQERSYFLVDLPSIAVVQSLPSCDSSNFML